jgi:phosphatidylglycerophosphate synthase
MDPDMGVEKPEETRSIFQLTPYLSETQRRNLHTYKYQGGDTGIIYTYFYNPVAKKLVTYLPVWLAPNLITLVGFIIVALPFILLFTLYGSKFVNDPNSPVANWFFFYYAASYGTYRLLDEMDGKQARRTNNSSPLGLLFDHGCDAFTMGYVSMIVAKTFQTGSSLGTMIVVMGACSTFYFSTLEEYYTGGLFLGVGNGVTDGSGPIVAGFIYLGFVGNTQLVNATPVFGLTGSELLVATANTYSALHFIFAMVTIVRRTRRTASYVRDDSDSHILELHLSELLAQTFGYFFPLLLLVSICYAGAQPVMQQSSKDSKIDLVFIVIYI